MLVSGLNDTARRRVNHDAFEEGVQDLASFMKRFPAAVSALITARVALDDARDAVLSRGGIKSVIAVV